MAAVSACMTPTQRALLDARLALCARQAVARELRQRVRVIGLSAASNWLRETEGTLDAYIQMPFSVMTEVGVVEAQSGRPD